MKIISRTVFKMTKYEYQLTEKMTFLEMKGHVAGYLVTKKNSGCII